MRSKYFGKVCMMNSQILCLRRNPVDHSSRIFVQKEVYFKISIYIQTCGGQCEWKNIQRIDAFFVMNHCVINFQVERFRFT